MFYVNPDLKTVKNMFKKLYLLLVVAAALACKASPSKQIKVDGSNDLQPDAQQSVVCKTVASFITDYNYKKVQLNDSISSIVFDRYIKSLDESRAYLMAADVKDFEKYRNVLDEDLKDGNLNDVFYIFNVFQKRYIERIKYSIAQLDKNYDFTQKDIYTFDRDSLPYIASQADMDDLWSKHVKFDLLTLKLADTNIVKDKALLKKRYEGLLSQSNKLNNQDVFQLFMDAFTNTIDPHTNYFDPSNAANFNIDMSRSLEGIGATLTSKEEYVTITSIVPGGPADKSKQLNADDRIIGVAQGKDSVFQNVIGWRLDNAIALIRGAKGTLVRLEVLPKGSGVGSKPKIVAMVREKIILKDQSVKSQVRTYNSNGKTVKIGIIMVPAFYVDYNDYKSGNPNYKSTTRDVKLVLDTLKRQGVDGVVMDLRQNGGGSLMEAIDLGGLFIKTGPIVQVRDTRNQIEADSDDDPSVAWSGPMAVLVDRFSASASEIFAGAMQDYGRALIIGTQTYGKGTVQNAIDLDKVISPSIKDMLNKITQQGGKTTSTGSESKFGQLNLTIAKFYRISGNSTQHKGVTPDIKFPSVIPLDKYGEDTEPSALPFDVIAKSDYTKTGDFSAVIPQLNKLHEQRMNKSVLYKYLQDDIADFKQRDAEKTVTLNEQELKKQRDADEQKTFERDNARRVALGLKPVAKNQPRPKNEDLDFLKFEAGQILTDYINMGSKYSSVTIKKEQ